MHSVANILLFGLSASLKVFMGLLCRMWQGFQRARKNHKSTKITAKFIFKKLDYEETHKTGYSTFATSDQFERGNICNESALH
jgi:inorganic triphosphatase YgiF